MFKTVLLLFVLAAVAVFSVVLAVKNDKLEVGTPVLAGSPILVLHH